MANALFIAATGQNIGKTTVSLGLLAALKKHYSSVGFLKPVGQRQVEISPDLRIDKDVALFQNVFDLEPDFALMSPVLVPRGFTRDYLDGEVSLAQLKQKIRASFDALSEKNSFTLVEGTGHAAVGSIIDLSNADVAKELGLPVVLVATGGLGSSFDELALSIEFFLRKGVRVAGVVLNRVLEEKLAMVREYMGKALQKYEIPLLGCIPYNTLLSTPSFADFASLFSVPLLAGEKNAGRHFEKIRLVASSLSVYEKEVIPGELVITPACRDDIIHLLIEKERSENLGAGLILTGRHAPTEETLQKIRSSEIPTLYAPTCSYEAMQKMAHFTAKIALGDTKKIEKAIEVVQKHISLEEFL